MLPHVFVRSGYAGGNICAQRKMQALVPALQAFVWTGTMMIGMMGIALCPGLKNGETEYLIPYLIETINAKSHSNLGIILVLGFFIGAVAVGISTADSLLLVAGTIASEDLIHHGLHMELSKKQSLMVTRVTICILGTLSIIFAVNYPHLRSAKRRGLLRGGPRTSFILA